VLLIRDVYPGIRIPDPTTAPKEEGRNFFVLPFFIANKYHKIVNNFISEQAKRIY
jgi:hypothetical protein